MSNERERLARQWARRLKDHPNMAADTNAAIDYILATTTEPTMADVEWDDEKHFLAGATHKETNAPLVMIGPAMADKTTDCVALSLKCGYQVENHNLTPNGKKYELVEVTDQHPETLTTEKDYKKATVGTIAIDQDGYPWVKTDAALWVSRKHEYLPQMMDMHGPHTVLRKGWGE